MAKTNYLRRLVDNKDPADAKRFLGLVMSAFLIVNAFVLQFTRIPNANTELLDRAMLYAFLIVLMSLFGLAVDKVAEILLQVSKTKAAATILTPSPTVNQVENVEGNIEGNKNPVPNPVTPPSKEDDDVAHDLKQIRKDLTNNLKTEIIG